jgi:AcrR family transcriptional regulator
MSDRINRKDLIIEIASDLFLKQGYEATSVRQIADAVGVTEAALYYHFKEGKRELLQAVFACQMPNFKQGGPYGYERLNVEDQEREEGSMLRWMSEALRTRSRVREFGRGRWVVHETGHQTVFAHSCTADSSSVVAVHNLSSGDALARLDLTELDGKRLEPLFGAREAIALEKGVAEMALPGYAYRWFRLR